MPRRGYHGAAADVDGRLTDDVQPKLDVTNTQYSLCVHKHAADVTTSCCPHNASISRHALLSPACRRSPLHASFLDQVSTNRRRVYDIRESEIVRVLGSWPVFHGLEAPGFAHIRTIPAQNGWSLCLGFDFAWDSRRLWK